MLKESDFIFEISGSVDTLRKRSEAGNPDGKFLLGIRYAEGVDVERDFAFAARLYLEAAKQQHDLSAYFLGRYFLEGKGVPPNKREAIYWLKRAQLPDADWIIGQCYERGDGVKQSYREAIKYFQSATDQGLVEAHVSLGRIYERGQGVLRDLKRARRLYEYGADEDPNSQFHLGRCYDHGLGGERDAKKACDAYFQAAQQGHAAAQYRLKQIIKDSAVRLI